VFLTGTLAVFYDEIDLLIYDEISVTPKREKHKPGQLYDPATAEIAERGLGAIGYMYMPLDRKRTAYGATLTQPGGASRNIFIDPYTGKVTGTTNELTVGYFLSALHTTLYLPVVGRAFVNFFGVLCLISLITGIINYPKFWRSFFRKPRFEKSTRVWVGDIHRLFGLWSMWFVLVIGVSGTWWFYQNPLVEYEVAPAILPAWTAPPGPTHDDLDASDGPPTRLPARAIVDIIWAQDPAFEVTYIQPPDHNGAPYSLWGTHRDILTGNYGSEYHVHPFTGEILLSKAGSELSTLQRVDYAMYPLHFGTWGNSGWADLAVKTVWFVFGALMTALALSGIVIYYKRTAKAANELLPESGRARQFARGWRVLRPWGGAMSGFKYANWVAIWFIGVGLTAAMTLSNQGSGAMGYKYVSQDVGDWTVSMNALKGWLEADLDPIVPGWQTNIWTQVESGDPDAIKFMYVKINKPRTTRAPGMVIHGVEGAKHAHMKVPDTLKDDAEIWLTIEDWQGNFHQARWPLMPDNQMTFDTRDTDAAELASALSATHTNP
ncbi:MAG: PepSY-associated TM helix domain-containing protein, partial [Pseudomonadota bacterium]